MHLVREWLALTVICASLCVFSISARADSTRALNDGLTDVQTRLGWTVTTGATIAREAPYPSVCGGLPSARGRYMSE